MGCCEEKYAVSPFFSHVLLFHNAFFESYQRNGLVASEVKSAYFQINFASYLVGQDRLLLWYELPKCEASEQKMGPKSKLKKKKLSYCHHLIRLEKTSMQK